MDGASIDMQREEASRDSAFVKVRLEVLTNVGLYFHSGEIQPYVSFAVGNLSKFDQIGANGQIAAKCRSAYSIHDVHTAAG